MCFTFLVGVPIVNCMIPIVIKGGKARKNDNNTYRYDTKCVWWINAESFTYDRRWSSSDRADYDLEIAFI